MQEKERSQLIRDVFAPKKGEHIVVLFDKPHGTLADNTLWQERRDMAQEWYQTLKDMGSRENFTVDIFGFEATGTHNAPVSPALIDLVTTYNIVIAMTEYSASASLLPVCHADGSTTRGASMPMVEKRMEKTAFTADYKEVQQYATIIKEFLNDAIGAHITFSTGDTLFLDLRNRGALMEAGECIKPGQFINFPSGEAFIAPFEGTFNEINEFGNSKTDGVMPVEYGGELVKYIIRQNRIVEVLGNGRKADEMRVFFTENESRKNIAELGVGCNPKAVVTGNTLEDEKVSGLHIAYGKSSHIGGQVDSDMHMDIVYAKGCPVEAIKLTLINNEGKKTDLIRDAKLRYELLRD